jgi:hypothetical protein
LGQLCGRREDGPEVDTVTTEALLKLIKIIESLGVVMFCMLVSSIKPSNFLRPNPTGEIAVAYESKTLD